MSRGRLGSHLLTHLAENPLEIPASFQSTVGPKGGRKGGKGRSFSGLKTRLRIIMHQPTTPEHAEEGSVTNQHPQRRTFAALGVVVTNSGLTKGH